MRTLMLLLTNVVFVVAQQAVSTADSVLKVRAVEHGDAIIPCGQSKIFLDGPGAFVSWVKDDKRVVYRFPINNSNTDEKSFNEICYRSPDLKPCRERTSLFLPRVTKDDSGFYRCRIHYNASPIVDFDFHLVIVERPGYPKIYNENGTAIDKDYIGPIPLGTDVTLVCEVNDGHESSVVQWERDGHRVAGSKLVQSGLHRAVLELRAIQRDQHGARYKCIAQPADVTLPLTKEVEVKMYLPPLSIKIDLNEKYDFEAGSPRVIDCVILGFIPTPTIEWYLDDKLLKPDTHQEIPGRNVTMSTLNLVTKRSDDNRILSCRAKNKYFEEVFSNTVRLHVGFKPTCAVKPKHRIKACVLEKVVCVVDSYPPPIAFTWTFSNTKIVATPVQETELPTRFKSTLSWIPTMDEIGRLNCTATNYHGKQEEPCQFDVIQPDFNIGEEVTPCYGVGNSILNQTKMAKGVQKNSQTPNAEESGYYDGLKNRKQRSQSNLDYDEESQVIGTHAREANTPWTPLLFLLGSVLLIGITIYGVGHWLTNKCRSREVPTDRIAMTYSSAERTNSSSPTSQQGLGSYHREPDVTERFTHQTNVNITPTPFALIRQNASTSGDVIYPLCHETHSYCV